MSEIVIEPQLPRSGQTTSNRAPLGRVAGYGALAIVLAVIANFIVLTIVVNALGLPEFGALSPTMVIVLTAIGVLLASIVFAIVNRTAQNPARTFRAIAVVALLLSFIPNILSMTGSFNVARLLGGGGARGPRAAQTQNGAADAGATPQANAPAGAAAPGDAQTGQAGQGRRNGQAFGAQRIPTQLSLMVMHIVAFAISLIVLSKAALAAEASGPKASGP